MAAGQQSRQNTSSPDKTQEELHNSPKENMATHNICLPPPLSETTEKAVHNYTGTNLQKKQRPQHQLQPYSPHSYQHDAMPSNLNFESSPLDRGLKATRYCVSRRTAAGNSRASRFVLLLTGELGWRNSTVLATDSFFLLASLPSIVYVASAVLLLPRPSNV